MSLLLLDSVTDISVEIPHHVPAFLQLTGAALPCREEDIRGGGDALVDVFLFAWHPKSVGLLVANEAGAAVEIGYEQNCEIRITVFPVSSALSGAADSRRFRIVGQEDGHNRLEMLPRDGATKTAIIAMSWFIGGLIPMILGAATVGLPGMAIGGVAGAYLVWYYLRDTPR